ncbi:MAG: flagellar assembly protein FliW [Solirubrobacterales bacterium]
MEFETTFYGVREYSKEDIIHFKKGLPGFENLKEFIIFDADDNKVFSVLQSVEDKNIGLIVISPFSQIKDYEFNLDDEIEKRLNIENSEDVLVLNTVTLNSKIEDITTNLRAPIIINIKNKLGEQIILNEDKYDIKHPLFKEGV